LQVLGSCIPDAVGPVVLATELGQPLDTVQLLQFSWEERLKLAVGVAQVLHHLAHSRLGSLAMADLRRQQFVLVDGRLKLSDVDDISISEPPCRTHSDCTPQHILDPYNTTRGDPLHCVRGVCEGHNERHNILKAGEHLMKHLLAGPAPQALEPHLSQLAEAYSGRGRPAPPGTETILALSKELLARYKGHAL
ncbi:hypothetical protein AAG570_003695, partial [Ranatra chinensis]